MKSALLALVVLAPQVGAQDSRPGSRPARPAPARRAERAVEPESDKKAVAVAERVLAAMGGGEALDRLQCIQWTIFNRTHVWDRKNHRHRVEVEGRDGKTLMLRDLTAGTCRVFMGGQEIGDEAELADHKSNAERWFDIDTWWFLFPARLLAPGVILALEADQKIGAADCHVLRVRFKDVAPDPKREYLAWVDKKTAMVVRWTYFETKDSPGVTWDWGPYERIGGVLLAGKHKAVDHKRDVDITGMKAFEQCKDEWFAPPAPGKG